jgi:hydroxymethylbilane synthase
MIRIGVRKSELAQREAKAVQAQLRKTGHDSELVVIKTRADVKSKKKTAAPLVETRDFFTRELESALRRGKVDCCVHALKHLAAERPEAFVISAVLPRTDPRDVLMINPVTGAENLEELPAGTRIGTSSLRRRAQLLSRRRDIELAELRGDIQTRIAAVDAGKVHAAIFSAADMLRLGITQRKMEFLATPDWLPAPGEGVIAIETRSDQAETRALLEKLNHQPTEIATRAERAFLSGIGDEFEVPVAAVALEAGGDLVLHGLIADPGGSEIIRGIKTVDRTNPEAAGAELAEELRLRGGNSLLLAMKETRQARAGQA